MVVLWKVHSHSVLCNTIWVLWALGIYMHVAVHVYCAGWNTRARECLTPLTRTRYPWGQHVLPRRSTSRPVTRVLVPSASCSLSSLASGTALSLMTLSYSWFSLCGKLLGFIEPRLATNNLCSVSHALSAYCPCVLGSCSADLWRRNGSISSPSHLLLQRLRACAEWQHFMLNVHC